MQNPSRLAAADGMQMSCSGRKPHEHLVDFCRERMTGHLGRASTAASCAYLRRPRRDVGLRGAAGPRSGPVTACHTTATRSGRVEMGSGCRRSARTGRRGQPRHDYCVQALRLWLTLPHRSPRAGVSDSAENAMSQPLGRQSHPPSSLAGVVLCTLNDRDGDAHILVLLTNVGGAMGRAVSR
jgi:hypothetical protein